MKRARGLRCAMARPAIESARIDRQLAVEHRFLVNTQAEVDRVATPILERHPRTWQVCGYLRRPGLSWPGEIRRLAVGRYRWPQHARQQPRQTSAATFHITLPIEAHADQHHQPQSRRRRGHGRRREVEGRRPRTSRVALLMVQALKTPALSRASRCRPGRPRGR